jgi:hypothetical protein
MTRIFEHRQDAAPGEELFELRVFQLRDGDVRACVVPADLAVDLDMMADMSEPVAQAYLNALALCETKALRPYGFTIRSDSFRNAIDRSWNRDEPGMPPSPTLTPTPCRKGMRGSEPIRRGQGLGLSAPRLRAIAVQSRRPIVAGLDGS